MATIKATWKRTVRVREYESETLELSVERNWDEVNDGDAVMASCALNRQLAREGDALVLERLSDRTAEKGKLGDYVLRPQDGPRDKKSPDPRSTGSHDEFM